MMSLRPHQDQPHQFINCYVKCFSEPKAFLKQFWGVFYRRRKLQSKYKFKLAQLTLHSEDFSRPDLCRDIGTKYYEQK